MPPRLKKLVKQVVKRYSHNKNVRAIFAVGSIARGDANAFSDIDLLVIVKKSVNYVRYDAGGTHIEIDSVTLNDVKKKLTNDPVQAYILSDFLPLFDPQRLEPNVLRIVNNFKKSYQVPGLAKADLYIQLVHHKLKIQSAIARKKPERAAFFAGTALEKCSGATYAVNNAIPRPAYQILQHYDELPKKPRNFAELLRRATVGATKQRTQAIVTWIDYLLPLLKPAMAKFPKYYKPWRA